MANPNNTKPMPAFVARCEKFSCKVTAVNTRHHCPFKTAWLSSIPSLFNQGKRTMLS